MSQLELFAVPVEVEDPPVLFKTYKDRIEAAKENIKKIVQESDIVCVGYSGGKDSTVLLHLVTEVLQGMSTQIKMYVLCCNTLVENPILEQVNNSILRKIKNFFKNSKINADVKIIVPKHTETYWVQLIGKGYPVPHRAFRWCQRVLKIKPVERFLENISKNQGVSLILGHRADESTARAKTFKKNGKNDALQGYGNISTFAPMRHMKEQDVWEFLMSESPFWDDSYDVTIQLYKDARGECPLIPEKGKTASGCGSRFGCWVCTLVQEDRSLKNMAKTDESLRPYLEFRNWLKEYCNRPENRSGYSRRGIRVKKGGVLSFEARRTILDKLYQLENQVNTKILSEKEKEIIKKQWEEDQRFFEFLEKGGITTWQPAI